MGNCILFALFFLVATANAQTNPNIKANNATALNANGSWVSGVAPNSTVVIKFDSTLTGTVTGANIGGAITVAGLLITDTGGSFSINKSSTNALTIGSSGIDMSSVSNSNNDFTINAPIVLSAAQTWNVASARTLTSANTIDLGGYVLTLAGAGTTSFSKIISGTGSSLLKTGSGTTILSAANTFDSGITVRAGTVEAQTNNAALGTGDVTLGDSLTSGSDDLSLLVASSSRTLANNITVAAQGNSTTIGGLNASGTSTYTGTITLAKDLLLSAAAGGTVRINGTLAGTGNITLVGAGTVNLDGGASTFVGNLTVNAGTLSFSTSDILPDAGGLIVNGGTVSLAAQSDTVNSVLLLNGSLVSSTGTLTANSIELQNGTVTAKLASTADLLKSTAGNVTLGASDVGVTGNLVIRDGTILAQTNNNALGAGNVVLGDSLTLGTDALGLLASTSGRNFANAIVVNNYGQSVTLGGNITSGTSTFSGQITLNRDTIFNSESGGTINFTGIIGGAGNITKNGAGTVILSNAGNAGSMTGAVNISAGTLSVGGGDAIGDTSAVTVQSGANMAITTTETVGSLAGAGNVTLSNGRVLTAGGNNQNTTFSGIVQGGNGASGIIKAGTGTLTLTNDNTYAGNTTISAGTLQIGDGTTSGSVAGNIVDNANLAFDNAAAQTYAGVVSGTGSLALISTSTLTLTNTNTNTGDTTIAGGTLQLGNGATSGSVAGNIVDNANLAFNNAAAQTYAGVISGTGAVAVIGSGNVTLTGQSNFTGSTTISNEVLQLANPTGPALANTSTITVNSGGTLLLGANDQINNSAGLVLAGGTLNSNGQSEGAGGSAGLGALTLSATSTLDLGSGSSVIAFADSSTAAWSGGLLYINNWNGSLTGGGTNQIYFGTSAGGLTTGQLADIVFVNPAGMASGYWRGQLLANGELLPAVPEPGTFAAGGGLTVLTAWFEWRRRRKMKAGLSLR